MNSRGEGPRDGKSLTKDKDPGAAGRLVQSVDRNRPIAWLVGLTAALLVFLTILPSSVWFLFRQGLATHKTLSTMLLVFSLLAVSLVWSAGQRVDAWVFLYFNVWGPRPFWLDRVMLAITQIGNGATSLAIALVMLLTGNRLLAYELVLSTLTLWLVVELFKALLRRSRPFIRLTQTRIVGYRARGRSFPSGHTSQAFFMATLMAQHFHTGLWAGLALYALAFLVGVTRMYVGAHYPRDVVAGAILGSAWGLLGVIIDPLILK